VYTGAVLADVFTWVCLKCVPRPPYCISATSTFLCTPFHHQGTRSRTGSSTGLHPTRYKWLQGGALEGWMDALCSCASYANPSRCTVYSWIYITCESADIDIFSGYFLKGPASSSGQTSVVVVSLTYITFLFHYGYKVSQLTFNTLAT
jgi:hypothetical protein